MLIAAGGEGNEKTLFIGLHQENVDKLLNDMPIRKPLKDPPAQVPGLEEWTIVIMGPEDTARFVAHFMP